MREKIKAFKTDLIIAIGYIVITLYATFPLVFNLRTSFYGIKADPMAWIWSFWWLKFAFIHGIASNFVTVLAAPFGVDYPVFYPIWNVFNRYLVLLTGEIAAYNLQIMFSFFLAAVAMYSLVFYLTKNRYAAFFSGLVYALSPYHFARSWDHLGLMNVHWMIFYIISLIALHKKPTYKRAFICGLCFACIGQFSNYYYVYFMGLLSILFFSFGAMYYYLKKIKVSFKQSVYFIKIAVIALIPLAAMMLPQIGCFLKISFTNVSQAKQSSLIRSLGQLFADSARPLNYLLPTEYHPIFGRLTKMFIDTPLYGENSGGEQSLYLGIVPLIFAWLGYSHWKKRKNNHDLDPQYDFLIRFFSIVFVAFMLCSFSPYVGSIDGFFIPLPIAFSTSLTAFTISFNSSGSKANL